ncbi:MAG: hypothetical protein M1816_003073 [Peltula sp. TS41687]|nr:MAG: hypothetical protein M1816_003073 [Peltula sp. TS41687]
MPAQPEKSQLKRGHISTGEEADAPKKARRSDYLQSESNTAAESNHPYLPSPLTHDLSTATDNWKETTASPPDGRPSQIQHRSPVVSPRAHQGLSSPPNDTQLFSQFVFPPSDLSHEVENEKAEGVWGYLIPLDKFGQTLVLRKRTACSTQASMKETGDGDTRKEPMENAGDTYLKEEQQFEENKKKALPSGGYILGRHRESDLLIDLPTISNRHCIIFAENSHGNTIAIIEDLSSNGTFVNEAIIGRNKRRELKDGDEITVVDEARFTFRYPRNNRTSGFRQQYSLLQQLGKGHFATVYLCVEKTTGQRYAVKVFSKRPGADDRSRNESLQQEIAVLMAVSHPNVLCLKDTYDEHDGVYLVLELAAEGELFNWIVLKGKMSENQARKVFIQLFQGVRYLHERNIVHRDIKPENILLVDSELTVKLADFGLAKIIGEESFTTTLCGTPSYVAPEILKESDHRKYTRAVDVWSLGVVLYICLCGFPPFSDELMSAENPYPLTEQIKRGHFDYPSPYWDDVGDPALELIDRMLEVDADKRITIDECLEHPWLVQTPAGPNDSTDGLTGALGKLDFAKRKVKRERTLLSDMNDVKVNKAINVAPDHPPVKVFEKNPGQQAAKEAANGGGDGHRGQVKKEATPGAQRDPGEFMQMGDKVDQPLFGDDAGSNYVPDAARPRDVHIRVSFDASRSLIHTRSRSLPSFATQQRRTYLRRIHPPISEDRQTVFTLIVMGLLAAIIGPITDRLHIESTSLIITSLLATFIVLAIVVNVLQQLWFQKPHEAPVVFHWIPLIGSTIAYGIDPYKFFFQCREKYGDVFTFILLGQKTTVCLGPKGNDFILNGKLKDLCAEDIYTHLTTPVFGKDVVYDCPNAKLMEQKKFVKYGLTHEALRSYVPLIVAEVKGYISRSPFFKGSKGIVDIATVMAEITICTATRSLQGKEVRDKFDSSSFAGLFHDLDNGFKPINFMLPWAPLPQNRKRDYAHKKVEQAYMEIIQARRDQGGEKTSEDMIWNLMSSVYKDGTPVPDSEVAHMMIALLMAGQHSSSSTGAWIVLRLASRPDIMEELYQEQLRVFGDDLPPLTYDDLQRLELHQNVLKETLRLHAPIHSMMRKVKAPMTIEGTPYVIPKSRVLLAAPGVTSRDDQFFPNAAYWDPHRWEEASHREQGDEKEEKVDYGYGLVSKGTNSPYLPFGAGRHRCIGEQFAYLQLSTILVTFVRELRVKNVGGRQGVVETDYSSLFSRPLGPAFIEWERRTKSTAS